MHQKPRVDTVQQLLDDALDAWKDTDASAGELMSAAMNLVLQFSDYVVKNCPKDALAHNQDQIVNNLTTIIDRVMAVGVKH